ncbi:MAG: DUF2200 family protein [Duganella sp.]
MSAQRIFTTPFSKVYPTYVQKAERKNRTKEEVDQIVCWLTGYEKPELDRCPAAPTTASPRPACRGRFYTGSTPTRRPVRTACCLRRA